MTIEFQTSKGEFIAVPWEEGLGKGWLVERISTVIGIYPSEFTEEMASSVVDEFDWGVIVGFKNYNKEEPLLDTALESFESLMADNRIYVSNPKSKEQPDKPFNWNDWDEVAEYQIELEQWQEAQQRTSKNWLIIKLNK